MNYYPFLFGAVTFFSTMSGGLIVLKYRKQIGVILAFAGSVLIAVSLLDLLPDSLDLAAKAQISTDSIMYVAAAGFVVLLVLERYLSVRLVHHQGETKYVREHRGGWFGTTEISIHSFIEGIALGFGFAIDFHIGIVLAIAIISHDLCDGINTVTVMLNSNNSVKASLLMLALVSTSPLLGVASTLFFTIPEKYLAWLIAFLVGGFLYLGAGDCLPEAYAKISPVRVAISCILGFGLIFTVSRIIAV